MFCPLCKSEYRDGVARCDNCQAPLVASLDAAHDNPPVLFWTGKNEAEFSAIVDAIRDKKIPALIHEQPRAALGNRLRPNSQIFVLQADLKRALQLAAASAASLPPAPQTIRNCHGCGDEVRDSFTHCPRCGTMLIASRNSPSPDSRPLARAELLFCPICDAHYASGHTHCTLCGVDLVPERLRGQPFDERLRADRLQVVWRGGDPVAVSRVIAALRGARIPHHVKPNQDHMAFELGIPRPRYEVRVFASDAAAAQHLLDPIHESPPFASLTDSPNPAQLEIVARSASPREISEPPLSDMGASHARWKHQQATREIWASDDSALAQILEDCLAENSIGLRVEGAAPGMLRLFVRPQEETRAREIIREVLDGSPRQ